MRKIVQNTLITDFEYDKMGCSQNSFSFIEWVGDCQTVDCKVFTMEAEEAKKEAAIKEEGEKNSLAENKKKSMFSESEIMGLIVGGVALAILMIAALVICFKVKFIFSILKTQRKQVEMLI